MSKSPPRVSVLEDGISITAGDRQATYGSMMENMECQELLMKVFEAFWKKKANVSNEAYHRSLGAIHHLFGKLARIAGGGVVHRDNFVDGAVYLAAAYEALVEEKPSDE